MTDYTAFDAKLLARIRKGGATFTALDTHMHGDAMPFAKPGAEVFRVTDRRLQALRKRGLIEYSGKTGWSAAAQKGTND